MGSENTHPRRGKVEAISRSAFVSASLTNNHRIPLLPSPRKATQSTSIMAAPPAIRAANNTYAKNIHKRGFVKPTLKEKPSKYPVGPILLGFFVFVVLGSSIFEIFTARYEMVAIVYRTRLISQPNTSSLFAKENQIQSLLLWLKNKNISSREARNATFRRKKQQTDTAKKVIAKETKRKT
ncbi:ribosome associated membrane protein RAMP4-domain-containing protein [Geranomyces variabilis]|nr:ribosome associated membrane protein RAMP4-domain-containing protein [Geranomyces variabilis]